MTSGVYKRTKEHKKRISDKLKTDYQSGKRKPMNPKGSKLSESAKERLRNPSDETRAKMRLSRSKWHGPFKDTKPELVMHEMLNGLDVKFEKNVPIRLSNGRYHKVDVLVSGSNIIIEVDGRYWHSRPENVERDLYQTKDLTNQGYEVIRIWDDEIFIPEVVEDKLWPLI